MIIEFFRKAWQLKKSSVSWKKKVSDYCLLKLSHQVRETFATMRERDENDIRELHISLNRKMRIAALYLSQK